jgi:hypothetical protein
MAKIVLYPEEVADAVVLANAIRTRCKEIFVESFWLSTS